MSESHSEPPSQVPSEASSQAPSEASSQAPSEASRESAGRADPRPERPIPARPPVPVREGLTTPASQPEDVTPKPPLEAVVTDDEGRMWRATVAGRALAARTGSMRAEVVLLVFTPDGGGEGGGAEAPVDAAAREALVPAAGLLGPEGLDEVGVLAALAHSIPHRAGGDPGP